MAGMLESKVAIVTGAGRGVGAAYARALAAEGAKVVVNDLHGSEDRTPTSAESVVAEIEATGGLASATACPT
jgi:NAD(P)-dependent dehydrogenase (short-subunit alcohol dehydrogenase family)